MAEAAIEIDQVLYKMLEGAAGPWQGVDRCPAVPVDRLHTKSYQGWVVRQPVRLAGKGMRFMVDVSMVAFVGSVEQAVPHFIIEGGVCQQLGGILGDVRDIGHR